MASDREGVTHHTILVFVQTVYLDGIFLYYSIGYRRI
jgi:hypothetical protein